MSEEKSCSKCQGQLKKGFYYVRNNSNPILFNYTVWVEGEKKNITEYMGSNANSPQFPVTPYKCEKCGYIELYADDSEKWRY